MVDKDGGVVFIVSFGVLMMDFCIMSDNIVFWFGGVVAYVGVKFKVIVGVIEFNNVGSGGGVYIGVDNILFMFVLIGMLLKMNLVIRGGVMYFVVNFVFGMLS